MVLLAPLALLGPLLLLAEVLVGLVRRGPLGWVAAVALVVVLEEATRRSARWLWRWWASTKAPVLPDPGVSGGTGRASAAPPDPSGGRSRG